VRCSCATGGPPVDTVAAANTAVSRATHLITDVRDLNPQEVWASLADIPVTDLVCTVIVLAAMVPDDRTITELVGWTRHLRPTRTTQVAVDFGVDMVVVDRYLRGHTTRVLRQSEKRAAADLAAGWGWTAQHLADATGVHTDTAEKALLRSRRRLAAAS